MKLKAHCLCPECIGFRLTRTKARVLYRLRKAIAGLGAWASGALAAYCLGLVLLALRGNEIAQQLQGEAMTSFIGAVIAFAFFLYWYRKPRHIPSVTAVKTWRNVGAM